MEDCIQILEAVFLNVQRSYLNRYYFSKHKTESSNVDSVIDEDLNMEGFDDPKSEKSDNTIQKHNTTLKKIDETINVKMDVDTEIEIRLEVEEKFPFAFAAVCTELSILDKRYREYHLLDEQPEFSSCYIDFLDAFPLASRFIPSCIYYITSMLLIDIDEKASDKYYEQFASAVSKIESEMPFELTKTTEVYPY